MDRSSTITLIKKTYTSDDLGQKIPTETQRTIYCQIGSISRAEWNAAGQMGLNPEIVATVFAPEYQGEEVAEINGVRYSIYRTYRDKGEKLELYLERKAGVTNVN